MSDRRDPSRADATLEGGSEAPVRPSSRFASLVGRAPGRRIARDRLALGAVVAVTALVLIVAAGSRATRGALDWLHRQPAYVLPFRSIELDPPPPAWIRGGARELLEDVRRQAGYGESLAVLEIDLSRLAEAFQRDPWIRAVEAVERRGRNRLGVKLAYREPVAFVRLDPKTRKVVVDGQGIVLPGDDLDLEAAGPLIELAGLGTPQAPVVLDARPGLSLRFDAAARSPLPTPEVLHRCLDLAAFFHGRGAHLASSRSPFQVVAIHVPRGPTSPFVEAAGPVMVQWGPPSGEESTDAPDDERTWELLQSWLDHHRLDEVRFQPDRTGRGGVYLQFRKDGFVVQSYRSSRTQ